MSNIYTNNATWGTGTGLGPQSPEVVSNLILDKFTRLVYVNTDVSNVFVQLPAVTGATYSDNFSVGGVIEFIDLGNNFENGITFNVNEADINNGISVNGLNSYTIYSNSNSFTVELVPNGSTASVSGKIVYTGNWIIESYITSASASISTSNLQDSSVTTVKISDSAVTTDKILDDAITNAKLSNSSVTTVKISDSAVTTDKILDDAITNAKLSNMEAGTIKGRIANTGTGDPVDLNSDQVREILGAGRENGLATLGSDGKVPTSQLPSYVDDVEEFANYATLIGASASAETGKIYVIIDTGDVYRWSGSAYVRINDAVSSADQATRLATARTISASGDATWSVSFDGTQNVSSSLTVSSGAISLSKMANLPANTIIGNDTGSSATPQALTATEVRTLLNVEDGAQVNVGTDLSITAGSTSGPVINSSTGTGATLPSASSTASGVLTTGSQTIAGTKTFTSNISGSINGNAATATTLQTARTINGVSFNGSSNITITANTTNALTAGDGLTASSIFDGSSAVTFTVDDTVVRTVDVQSISGDKTFTDKVLIQGSSQSEVLFSVSGTQGELFSITDDLDGLLFSINDISGLPVFEVYSDNTVKLGEFGSEAIIVEGSEVKLNNAQSDNSVTTGLFLNDSNQIVKRTINTSAFSDVNDGLLTLATSGIATGSATFSANQLGSATFTVSVPGTNIAQGTRTSTSVPITSSTGTDATLSAATTTLAGVMTSTDKTKLDGIEESANNYVHPTHAGDDIDIDTGVLSGATVISDLDFNVTTDTLGHVTDANATYSTRTLTTSDIGAEPAFTKNTAFNKNFGTTTGTVAQGNDSRIVNGQTAFGWGDHSVEGYLTDISISVVDSVDVEQFVINNGNRLAFDGDGATSVTFDVGNKKVIISSTDTNTTYSGSTSIVLNGSSFERAALTGDVTSSQNSNTLTIGDNKVTTAKILDSNVTNSKLAEMAASTIKGRIDTAGNPQDLTAAQVRTILGAGDPNGLATLGSDGKVPTSQLPSYVDDVIEATDFASLPAGETGKIYVTLDNGNIYRWSGSGYVQINDAVTSADQATSLSTARTISATGDATWSVTFDGSQNVSGSLTISSAAVEASMLNDNIISGKTALTSGLVSTDELMISDAGTIKRMDVSVLQSYMQSNLAFSNNAGTVTSVGGTGTVNGITLTGTVTSSGNLTLGGSLSGITVAQLAGSAVITSAESFADSDTALLTAAAVDDRILSYGYTTNVGDITAVTAGTGLSGGGTSGSVTLTNSDPGSSQDIFKNIENSDGSSRITASSNDDIFKIVGAGAAEVTLDPATKTITVTSSDTNTTYSGSTSVTLSGTSFERAALTGDVTASANSNVTTISNGAVTLAKMANLPANTIIGNDTGSSATPQALTAAEVRTLINVADGANNYVHPTHAGDDIDIDTGALSGATVISDLDFNITTDTLGHVTDANATYSTRTLTPANIGAEPAFTKNTAFNKNFGTTAGTVAEGDDSRIVNGQTAFGWGDHTTQGYLTNILLNVNNEADVTQFSLENNSSVKFTGSGSSTVSFDPLTNAINISSTDTNTTYTGSTSVILNSGSFERAALTGDVTSPQNSNATTIAASAVTLAKMANLPANTIVGNDTGSSATPQALTISEVKTMLGAGSVNGLATLGSDGKVPTSQLPSYVDDVLEYVDYATMVASSGETGKIYVTLDNGDIYRWSGSAYIQINDAVSSADQASALSTARSITVTGDASWSVTFDGSQNVSANLTIASGAVESSMLNNNIISGQTELASGLASTDELMVSDAGTIKRMDISVLQSYMQSSLSFSNNAGTVTSVGGTGTVNGITLTGSVTSSGNLTLGGSLSGITVAQLAGSAVITSAESFADSDTALLTAAAVDDRILSYGYTTNVGDITEVVAGTGLSGGGTSGSVTLTNSDPGSSQSIFKNIENSDGSVKITASINDDTFKIVGAGASEVTLDPANKTITITSTDTNTNNYVSGVSFNTSDGILTFTRSGLSNLTVDLDGRFLTGNQTITLSGDVSGSGSTSIAVTIAADAVEASMLNDNVISGQTELASGLVSTDELMVSDAGVIKRMDVSVLQSYMQSNLTFNTGDITAVTAGNGLTGGGTSGDVTLNVVGGSGISVTADEVAVDSTVVRTTGAQSIAGLKTFTDTLTIDNATAGATLLDIQGTQGQLFSIVDSLTGSLFSVNDISGIPIFEVFSDETVKIGTFNSEAIIVEGNQVKFQQAATDNAVVTGLFLNASNQLVKRDLGSGAFSSAVTVNDSTITISSGTGLSTGGSFTTNQSTNSTITLNLDLNELSTSTANGDGDYFVVVDTSGAQRKLTKANINLSEFNNNSGWTSNTGTVTSVGGTGTVNGITLTGSVTSSGNLTLGGSLSGITVSQLSGSAVITSAESFADSDTALLTAAAVDDRILSYGYTTNVGDITEVVAGTGLSGGGTSGSVTLTNSDPGSSQSIFKNFAVSGQSTVSAESNDDTLTLVAGTNVTITTDAASDTITITATDTNTTYTGSTSITLNGTSFERSALTGDITASANSNATTIANNVVTNAKLADMAVNTIKGRVTAGTGDPEDLTATQVRTILGAGSANGLATLGSDGKVPTSQLPSYVDDVVEATDFASLPAGETGKIYVTLDNNNIYRWSGSGYVQINDAVTSADQATSLSTARTISATGDASWSVTFDGSQNVSGSLTIASGAIESSMLNNNIISGLTALTSGLVSTDELMVSDAGTIKRMDISVLQSYMQSNLAFSNNAGTVTSVGGTGTVNGITLTGTVTSSGNLTLGGSLSGITVSQLDGAAVITSAESFADSDTALLTAAAVDDRILSYGYTTNVGDITAVTAGTGLSGGGTSGSVTLTNTDPGSSQNIFKNILNFDGSIEMAASSNNDSFKIVGAGAAEVALDPATKTITITSTDTNTTYSAGTGLSLAGTTFALSHLGIQNLSDPNADRIAFWDDSAGAFAWLTVSTGLLLSGTTLTNNDLGSSQAIFKNFAVSGQSTVSAESNNDTLTLVAGTNVTITTDAASDTITITATTHDAVTIGTANGLSLSTQVLSLAAASDVTAGAVTTGTQTFAGAKTFSSDVSISPNNGKLNFTGNGQKTISTTLNDLVIDLNSTEDICAVIIDDTVAEAKLHVKGDYSANGVSIYATHDIVAFSDASVKTNIRNIDSALNRVVNSRGVIYDRIDTDAKDNIGFIAQELEQQFPELVYTQSDGKKAVKYQNAVAVLFEAIKEQQKQIEDIKKLLDK